MITEVKMEVTPDLSERVQEIVFANDGYWGEANGQNREVKYTGEKYIYISSEGKLNINLFDESYKQNKYKEISAYDFIASQGEQEWLPKYKEEVEFSDDREEWHKDYYGNYAPNSEYHYRTINNNLWRYCRPTKQTKTISVEGKKVEISNECFNKLKELLGE